MKTRFVEQKVGLGGAIGASLTLALGGVSACVDGFSEGGCTVSRTCPAQEAAGAGGHASNDDNSDVQSGGAGAASGEGGAAASVGGEGGAAASLGGEGGAAPDCDKHLDCDDHLACNGVETCGADGRCVSAKPPACTNPDKLNCSVACVESGSTYKCVVEGSDSDGDGHTSALCAPMPGNDCDDARESVFAGAPELCDRLDNDCDEKVDLADGLEFSGEALWVGRDVDSAVHAESAVAAWSEASQLYGLFWKVRGTTDLVVALYDADGVNKAGPTTVGHSSVERLAISAGATGFGVAWNSDTEQVTKFRTIGAEGVVGDEVSLTGRLGVATGALGLAWSSWAQRWEVVADHGVGSVSEAGLNEGFVSALPSGVRIDAVEVAASGSSFLIAVSGRTGGASKVLTPSPLLYRHLANTTVSSADRITFDYPVASAVLHVAARSDGSFAALTGSGQVTVFDAEGARRCGYQEPESASAMTGTVNGYTLALAANPTTGSLRELSTDCVPGELIPTGFLYPLSPTLIASPTSYCKVWRDDDGNSFYSIFGSNYCN